jgi:AcrR family transcriptional regulator
MQRVVDAVTHQFREAVFDRDQPEDAVAELRTLVGIYFDVVTDLQSVNRARLALWADAVANPDEETRSRMVAADREFREEIEKRIEQAATAGEIPRTVHPRGLATVIIAMLRGVALQSLIDDHVDLDAARGEVEALLIHRLQSEQKESRPS